MSKFRRAEDAIGYYTTPTYYCAELGCDWFQETEWNVGAMAAAKRAGIKHWNAVHKAVSDMPDRSVAVIAPGTELIGRDLTSQDPEPPIGTVVSCMGNLWLRFELGWERLDGKDDPESWAKIAGNYGPVTVVTLPLSHQRP